MSIHQDIYPFLGKEGAPAKANLRDALTYYTHNIHYFEAVIKSTHRYDLEGNTSQEITQEQKTYAQERFEKTLQAIKAKKSHKNKNLKEEKRRQTFTKRDG